MSRISLFLGLFLFSVSAQASSSLFDPSLARGPIENRWVRTIDRKTADSGRGVLGTWKVKVAPSGAALELAVQITPTPSCPSGLAIFYASADEKGITPGAARRDGLSFSLKLGGAPYLLDLVANGEKSMAGKLIDFKTQKETAAEASFVDPKHSVQIVPATASANSTPREYALSATMKAWLIRAPQLGSMPADIVTHPDTKDLFACYAFRGAVGYAYSASPLFLIVLADMGGKEMWKFQGSATVREQKNPFILSFVADDGDAIDFVKR